MEDGRGEGATPPLRPQREIARPCAEVNREDEASAVPVGQNAHVALTVSRRAYVRETGRV